MSNIAEFLQKILSARYGKDVRQSIHDAIEEVDKVADTAQKSATKAAEAARESEQASSLNALEAEAFRNEAEQFRNEAELFTPDGYDVFVQIAAETKERVDDLEENLETVSSDVETNKSDIEKVSFKVDTVIEKADLRIKETATGESIYLTDSADAKAVEFGLYGKATQNGTPSPDNEVDIEISGASGSVGVKSCGAQLLNYGAWKNVVAAGATVVFENNGITMTATDVDAHTLYTVGSFPEKAQIPANEGDIITISWEENDNKSGRIFIFGYSKTDYVSSISVNNNVAKSLTYIVPASVTFITFRFGVSNAGDVISYKNIMVNKGSVALPYEPYKETSFTIPTPNGLAGIAVNSGGNYIDENGQQWICDVIVKYADGSGEYIEHIKKYSLRIADMNLGDEWPGWRNAEEIEEVVGGSNINTLLVGTSNICRDVLANTDAQQAILFASSGLGYTQTELKNKFPDLVVDICVKRAIPIRTPLTAEQIAEIEKLQTFYSVTNIYNDADCGMGVTYIVDAKKYIDNKIAELATAMVNNI